MRQRPDKWGTGYFRKTGAHIYLSEQVMIIRQCCAHSQFPSSQTLLQAQHPQHHQHPAGIDSKKRLTQHALLHMMLVMLGVRPPGLTNQPNTHPSQAYFCDLYRETRAVPSILTLTSLPNLLKGHPRTNPWILLKSTKGCIFPWEARLTTTPNPKIPSRKHPRLTCRVSLHIQGSSTKRFRVS